MTEHFSGAPGGEPADNINTHPGFRTLEGVDSTSGVAPALAAKIDILQGSNELQRFSDVRVGDIVRIGFLNEQGENRSLEFLRTPNTSEVPSWLRLDGGFDESGNFTGEPAFIYGSTPEKGGPTAIDSVLKYNRLTYVEPHDIYVQSGEGLPDDHPAAGYISVDQVNPRIVEENLKMGIMERTPEGALFWKIPTSPQLLMSEPITTADIIRPYPDHQHVSADS